MNTLRSPTERGGNSDLRPTPAAPHLDTTVCRPTRTAAERPHDSWNWAARERMPATDSFRCIAVAEAARAHGRSLSPAGARRCRHDGGWPAISVGQSASWRRPSMAERFGSVSLSPCRRRSALRGSRHRTLARSSAPGIQTMRCSCSASICSSLISSTSRSTSRVCWPSCGGGTS